MAKITDRHSTIERMYRILEYLRENTDSSHPVTQRELKDNCEVAEFVGHKESYNKLIKEMAEVMNSNNYCPGECKYKKEENWKIHFEDFKKYYEKYMDYYNGESDVEVEDAISQSMRIRGLYYQRTFSYDDVSNLIEGVRSIRTLDTESANNLITKIEKCLTTKYYKKGPRHICKVREKELVNREDLRANLLTIQEAIDNNVKIAFTFNGYSYEKTLEPIRENKDIVSPYYIVTNGGRYYLLACIEDSRYSERNMSIWRIDLMTDIEIPSENKMMGIPGEKRTALRDVKNMPEKWDDNFQFKHLNMSFDMPVPITLKIKSKKVMGYSGERVSPGYTFMHDSFGDTFKYIKTESEPPYDDIVVVECSPFGMVNWAMQYSDLVEVVKPEAVRNAVIEKIRAINAKYGVTLKSV